MNQKALIVNNMEKEYYTHITERQNIPSSFSAILKYHMEYRNISNAQLAYILGVSPSYISSLTNEDCHEAIRHSTKLIVSICIALKLPPSMSSNLLSYAGCELLNNSKDRAYEFLLNYYFNTSIEECNRILEHLGYTPLTKF